MTSSCNKPDKSKRTVSRTRGIVCLCVMLIIMLGFSLLPGVGSLCAAGVGAVAALCPLGILETILAEKLMVPPLLIALVCMVVVVALLGRTFCSWVCPVPHIGSFFHPKKMTKGLDVETKGEEAVAAAQGIKPLSEEEKRSLSMACHGSGASLRPIGGKRDGLQLDTRHFVLVGALASTAAFGLPVFCLVCPVGLTIGTLVAVWIALVDHNPTWMLLAFPLILVLELAVFRKWCHVLCPMGALMSLIGVKAPVGKPHVDSDACLRSQGIDCRTCVHVCPEQLDPHAAGLSECTRCGLCMENCPGDAISMRLVGVGKPRRADSAGAAMQNRAAVAADARDEGAECD